MTIEARERALAILYEADLRGWTSLPDGIEMGGRVRRLVEGVLSNRTAIDAAIDAVSEHWRVERMPAVDRAILRLAAFELRSGDTPAPVVVSEAVRMAKVYSTEKSGAFVNGVLAALARKIDGANPADDTLV